MGLTRNGARSFLNLAKKMCDLSHIPGFRAGINRILGTDDALALLAVWDPFCAVVDLLISADDWYNKRDATTPSETGGEDTVLL
jgi:hypothetical protein